MEQSSSFEKMASLSCQLRHHGAAACSSRSAVTWIRQESTSRPEERPDRLVYASHAIVNVALQQTGKLANGVEERIWNVQQTLRTQLLEQADRSIAVITTLCSIPNGSGGCCLASGFSDGSINVWINDEKSTSEWNETVLVTSAEAGRSITVLKGIWLTGDVLVLISGTSVGARLHTCIRLVGSALDQPPHMQVLSTTSLLETAVYALHVQKHDVTGSIFIFVGTASPRHNRIHVYHLEPQQQEEQQITKPEYAGFLSGHEDWISGFDWCTMPTPRHESAAAAAATSLASTSAGILASASQDCKIRLWKFTTTTMALSATTWDDRAVHDGDSSPPLPYETIPPETHLIEETDDDDDDDEERRNDEEEQDEEGESRMEIVHKECRRVTNVILDALLIGHEDQVTSVQWHPNPRPIYGQDLLLISSSMDRVILLWAPGEDGIWTPLSRVGSAGGILGGSVGSTLLGYCHATLNPTDGTILIGHAYGGALHVWSLNDTLLCQIKDQPDLSSMTIEQRSAFLVWRASPCVTGHFGGVTDLCWEAETGQYLLTVSLDQTCRLWAPIATSSPEEASIWVELARPQVHGYDLSAVASLSDATNPHLLVSGADEKEIRVLDAPKTTIRMLQAASGLSKSVDPVERMERAYIPSLGLSNKASAADGAAEADTSDPSDTRMEESSMNLIRLPLERDLGAVSLWPEVRKLFGHGTELHCLASSLSAHTAPESLYSKRGQYVSLVASSGKARDTDAAAIRLWNVPEGACVQVLSGGHKSTIATMAFSPDGCYLASSGKDRRLCIWKRNELGHQFDLMWAKDSAHKRIVWSVHFCPFEETILASGSRDGCIKIWKIAEGPTHDARVLYSFAPSFHRNLKPDPVTALSFAPIPGSDGSAILAVGLESGHIELWSIPIGTNADPQLLLQFAPSICHIATIRKLAWKPMPWGTVVRGSQYLASCSMDHGCRIYEVRME